MATLGNVPAEAYTNTVKDSFSGNGSATAFTMSLPTVTNDVRVVVENVIQDPTVAYSVSGTTLTFTSAPPSGTNNIYVVHLGPAVMTTVPPAEIADATTFASSLTVQGAFTSVGIDDNADAVALTIDSSENVLIGKTSADGTGSTGHDIRATGLAYHTVDGGDVKVLNRLNSDGGILSFRKDGATIGSIGNNTDFYIASQDGCGLRFTNNQVLPCSESGATQTTSRDLGSSGARFRDLYLSGGVVFDAVSGNATSNTLDDYEEGTFTLTWSGTGGTANSTNVMSYVKVGSRVTINGNTSSAVPNATGTLELTGLPFAANDDAVGAMLYRHMSPPSGAHNLVVYIGSGQTKLQPYWASGSAYSRLTSSQFAVSANNDIYFSITYQTNS